jgi:hypothetical protein
MSAERQGPTGAFAIFGNGAAVVLAAVGGLLLYFDQFAPGGVALFAAALTLFFIQKHFVAEFSKLARPYWWPALLILALGYAIMFNDQVRDLLEASTLEPIGGDVGLTNTLWWLLAASAYFGFTAWTFLRLASEFDVANHAGGGDVRADEAPNWRNVVRLQAARLAGVALPLVIAGRYLQLGYQSAQGPLDNPYMRESGAFFALAVVLFLIFWLRRVIVDRENAGAALLGHTAVVRQAKKIQAGAPRIWLYVLAAVHVVLLGLTILAGVNVPTRLGAPALVIMASAGFLGVGWMLFTYLPFRTKWPAVPVFFFSWVLLVSVWNDNHDVRLMEDVENFAPRPPVDADAYARAWLADRERLMQPSCAPWPIFVVAAEGGGVRAAYWTGAVLGRLEEETRGLAEECGSFADHVFMISGVSGGALGAAAFAAALKDGWDEPSSGGGRRGDEARNPRVAAREFLSHDFLSPTVASLVYPDALARFWFLEGRYVARADRARWMERAWEARWAEETEGASFTSEYRSLWSEGRVAEILDRAALLESGEEPSPLAAESTRTPAPPVLAMNTTSVQSGAKWVLGPVRFESAAAQLRVCESGQFEDLEAGPLTLATAVHLSARFTYISPAGRVDTEAACSDDGSDRAGPVTKYMRFVDGGYFEDSGAQTAFEAIAALRRVLLEECGRNPDAHAYCRAPIVPLAITTEASPPSDQPPRFAPEMRSPVSAVFAAREARGYAARRLFSVSGDRVGAEGGALSRSQEPFVARADKLEPVATRSPGAAPAEGKQLYIDIHLPREWGAPCPGAGVAAERAQRDAFDTPFAICGRDERAPSRLLPLGWTLSQWAAERMDSALDAQFQRDGCGFAAAVLVLGGADARAALAQGAPLEDGRCSGIRWRGEAMRSAR